MGRYSLFPGIEKNGQIPYDKQQDIYTDLLRN
jgi:hypothetical protein